MRTFITSAVRLFIVGAAALTAVAIVLGRGEPRSAEFRRMEAPRYQPISGHLFPESDPNLRLLDLETGTLVPAPHGGLARLAQAACPPWKDGQGRSQVAGVWTGFDRGAGRMTGLARYALPGGKAVDRIVIDVAP